MRYTILGFSQLKAMELELKLEDLALLRYFKDFIDGGKMVTKDIGDNRFYWFKYDNVAKELPILTLKKDAVYRRLKALSNKEVLIHKTIKQGGTYSYYALGKRFFELESKGEILTHEGAKNNLLKGQILNNGTALDKKHYGDKVEEGTVLKPKQNINIQKDKPIKDTFTKIIATNTEKSDIYNLYSSCGNGLDNTIISTLDRLILTYKEEWVREAIEESFFRGKTNLRYIEGILLNWESDGYKAKTKSVINS